MRQIANIAVSVFAVVVGFKMWFTTDGMTSFVALAIILIGVSALENNVTALLKARHAKQVRRAD
jgi:hypothetical protein